MMLADELLPAWYRKATMPPDRCACQYGPCGHCYQLGRHDQCNKATGWQPGPQPAAYLNSRRTGGVLAEMHSTGRECRYLCPCACPPAAPTPAQRNLILQCARHKKAKPTRSTDADLVACMSAGWIVKGYGWYATTEAGSAAARIEHDAAEYESRMGPPLGQLGLFELAVAS